MSQKPSDFLIGISEFISILLPGAVAAFALQGSLHEVMGSLGLERPTGAAGWVAFIVVSYLAGHLIFLLGSVLDKPYDLLRQRFKPREKDEAYQAATRIAKALLKDDSSATNTYKVSTAILTLRHEHAASEVRQFEADSKFFRSLSILILLLLIAKGRALPFEAVIGAVLLELACLWRYVERRWKATRRAFEYLVTLKSIGQLGPVE